MIRLLDHFIIAVSQVYDEGDVAGLKSLNVAYYDEKERDRYERKIIKGTVYRTPVAYSEEHHMPIDPGIPNPKLFIGHDAIQRQVAYGYKWGNEKYHPGTTEHFKYVSRGNYGERITAKEGDEIYFHPSVTEPENYHGRHGEMELYRAQVHELIAIGTQTQGFYLLVHPHADVSELSGLALETQDRALEGTVRYAHPKSGLKTGDFIYFQEGSDWSFDINGERLYAMLEENVLGVREEILV